MISGITWRPVFWPLESTCAPLLAGWVIGIRARPSMSIRTSCQRPTKKQQMRWNRTTVQSFLDVRTAVLNDNLEDAFRHRYPGFRPTNDDQVMSEAA